VGADSRTPRRADRNRRKKKGRLELWSIALATLALAGVWLAVVWLTDPGRDGQRQVADGGELSGQAEPVLADEPVPEPEPVKRTIVDFRMLDLDTGWYEYDDGTVMVTGDGGVTWREAGPDWTLPEEDVPAAGAADGPVAGAGGEAVAPGEPDRLAAGSDAGSPDEPGAHGDAVSEADGALANDAEANGQAALLAALREIEAAYLDFDPSLPIVIDGKPIAAKRVQPVSGRIGWALADGSEGLDNPLLVSVDGGLTWHQEVTAEVRAAIGAEKERRRLRAEEAALYAVPQQVMKPGSGWILLPDVTYPGDVILVRRDEPGEVEWQGKTYALKPYKAGYFTYLPVPRSTKPGAYTVGGAQLTVREKKFNTQYLTVSEEMESMRRNTERIAEDQKKIDEARSHSAETFLFDSAFLKPIEGRLSTPYGYTRYINGKLSSTHNAIDLAAPKGTPIAAANDGVVALADDLYLTGLTIYIDRGMGLFSQYAHLSELNVSAGDTVKKGDIIGLVGSTGFSTGPHLHFTFWAHNTPVNPDLFFDTTPFRWTGESDP